MLSVFLSRQAHDDSNPHEIIPVSFNMYNVLYETYYRIEMKDQYLVQTHSQMKVAGIVLLEVHRAKKAITVESPKPQIPVKQVDKNKPRPPENVWPGSPENKSVIKPKIDVEFEENSLHQEGIISEFYQRPDKSYLQQLKNLENLVNTGNLVQKFLPKQTDRDKILKIIQ